MPSYSVKYMCTIDGAPSTGQGVIDCPVDVPAGSREGRLRLADAVADQLRAEGVTTTGVTITQADRV